MLIRQHTKIDYMYVFMFVIGLKAESKNRFVKKKSYTVTVVYTKLIEKAWVFDKEA